jgi:hypothetical protein
MTQSMASTTWVAFNRSRIFVFLPEKPYLYRHHDGADPSAQMARVLP